MTQWLNLDAFRLMLPAAAECKKNNNKQKCSKAALVGH